MQQVKQRYLSVIAKNTVWLTVSVIGAVLLPQLFHTFGLATGQGPTFGQMFLPMYLPVMILAFQRGAALGVTAGVLSPLISFAVSGMPTTGMLPFIMTELVCIGLFAGLITRKPWHIVTKIVTVQLVSRFVRIVATLLSAYLITHTAVTFSAIFDTLLLSVPGFILQLLVVPYFFKKGSADHAS